MAPVGPHVTDINPDYRTKAHRVAGEIACRCFRCGRKVIKPRFAIYLNADDMLLAHDGGSRFLIGSECAEYVPDGYVHRIGAMA